MTVIYVDTLFFINSVIDYLLLLAAARISGEPLHRLRFAFGAAVGGLYAVGMFVPGFSFLRRAFYKVLFAVLMLLIAYGFGRRILRQGLFFLLLTCALGGAVTAIGMFGGQGLMLGNGVFYSSMDQKTVLLSGAICYVLMGVALERAGKYSRAGGELLELKINLMGKSVELTGLLDTGNRLTDPISGQSVSVVEADALSGLFPAAIWSRIRGVDDPPHVLSEIETGVWQGRFRLLPYRTVGVANGLLLGVRSDWIEINGKRKEGALFALSPTPLSDGGGYRAMVGRDGMM